jgi:cation transport regulator ChaC
MINLGEQWIDNSERSHPYQIDSDPKTTLNLELQPTLKDAESMFYYFAYGSCMCPVDLKRSLDEITHPYIIGAGTLQSYRLGFYRYSPTRKCGVLDVVKDSNSSVKGVLYQLPLRLSDKLDRREDVPKGGYRREKIEIKCQGQIYKNVRTYVVINKLTQEVAPNDWYFNVVLRGAVTCGLPEEYCWNLFNHMYQLQQQQQTSIIQPA